MRCQRCHNDFVRKMPDHVGPVVRSGNGSRFSEGEFEALEDQIWFIGEDK